MTAKMIIGLLTGANKKTTESFLYDGIHPDRFKAGQSDYFMIK